MLQLELFDSTLGYPEPESFHAGVARRYARMRKTHPLPLSPMRERAKDWRAKVVIRTYDINPLKKEKIDL